MSTEDGPGIRTSVFFKGCSLRCDWCHNPESIEFKPQLHWIGSRCIGCLACLAACPQQALRQGASSIEIDRKKCQGCGACAEECPSTALELMGARWELPALIDETLKDRAFFERSGGGITVTGGEPAAQAEFVAEFLKGLIERGVHTALDTCGQCADSALDALLPHADLVLFDLKLIDPARHKQHTGHDTQRIHESFRRVVAARRKAGRPSELWVRTPIIPNATDDEANIMAIGRFLASEADGAVARWELCAFNNLCRDKYKRLGLNWIYKDAELIPGPALERLADVARRSGVDPKIVFATGATRIEQRASVERPQLKLVNPCCSGEVK